jgi:hypothetical protein
LTPKPSKIFFRTKSLKIFTKYENQKFSIKSVKILKNVKIKNSLQKA